MITKLKIWIPDSRTWETTADLSLKSRFRILFFRVKGAAKLSYQNLAVGVAQTTKLYLFNKLIYRKHKCREPLDLIQQQSPNLADQERGDWMMHT
jgi:hypothetical protein